MEESCGAVKHRHRTFYTTMSKAKTFKTKKLYQMRQAIKSFLNFKQGCAFCPGYNMARAENILNALDKWYVEMAKAKKGEWGR